MRLLGIRFAAACAVALLSAVAPAHAEEAQPTAPVEGQTAAPAAEPASDPNEVICKKLESETGTRIGRRKECRTRKEWDQIAEAAKQDLEKAQD